MYQLNDDRRITQFIKTEAYKWLYKNLRAYDYTNTIAEDLSMQINKDGKLTESTYKQFIRLFNNNPISRKLDGFSNNQSIASDDIYKYFILYNGHILPIGFIIEFFEDDYEEREKSGNLINAFLNYSKDNIISIWSTKEFEFARKIKERKNNLTNIYACKVSTYIIYVVSVVLFAVLINVFFGFLNTIKVKEVVFEEFIFGQERELTVHVPIFNLGAETETLLAYTDLNSLYEAYIEAENGRNEDAIDAWSPVLEDYYAAQYPQVKINYDNALLAEEAYESAHNVFNTAWNQFLLDFELNEITYEEYGMNLTYSIDEYLAKFGIYWFYLIILFYILAKIVPFIKELIYIIRASVAKIKISCHEKVANICKDTGNEKLEILSSELITEYMVQPKDISEAEPIPAISRLFSKLYRYDLKLDPDSKSSYDRYEKIENKKGVTSLKRHIVFLIIMLVVGYAISVPLIYEFMLEQLEKFTG